MADIYKAVKGLVEQVISSKEFCDIEMGEVLSIKPLKIKVSDRIILNQSQIMLTDSITEKTVNLAHKHENDDRLELTMPVVIRDGLKKGDKVLMLKVQGGQNYVAISKVIKL